jgi:tetratricopeptide (TPR) repeat protein
MNRHMSGRDESEAGDAGFGESSRYAAHLDRGWALLDRGDLEAARTSVQHAQDVRPDDPDAALLLGAIALAEGKPDEALRCYERAIELDPEYLEPHAAAAAVCLFDLDDPTRGLRYATEALELDELAPLERLDLELLAAECEIVGDDLAGAHERLAALEGLDVLEAALDLDVHGGEVGDETTDKPGTEGPRAIAYRWLALDADGEPLEDDERIDRGQRALGLAMRLCQLRIDARHEGPAYTLLNRLVALYPRDPEPWSLLAEVEFRRNAPAAAARAGAKTLELDTAAALPDFVPSPAVVHRRVVGTLAHCGETRLASLVEGDAAPIVIVRDLPPVELVLEGASPRAAVTITAARDPSDDGPAALTGIVVYRKNLARFARDADSFDEELRFAVLEELAFFFGLSAKSRRNLGLDAGPIEPLRGDESLIDAKPRRRKGPARKRKD